ncbi:ATP-binding protein [Spirosoma harenae]
MLKRVSIQNFKSLKDVTLDLQKVNLLIGPNNSGKTNFLKALEFFSDSVAGNDKFSFSRNVKYMQYGDNLVDMHLVFDNKEPFKSEKYEHLLIAENDNDFEDLNYKVSVHSELSDSLEIAENETFYEFSKEDLITHVGKLEIYKPDPNRIVQPAYFSADEIALKGDCSNLIQFLFYLNTNYKRAYQYIEKDLASCVGDIVSFSTPPVKVGNESKLGLKFFGKNDEDYWAENVSEGVVYFLSLLTIINQPNPPKLLLLEEPEKGIHPRRLFEVMQFILGLVEDKDVQVIMTTHSPTVVDMFKDMPESVFIFDKDEEGATHVKNLLHDVIEPETAKSKELGIEPPHYTDSLGDAWTVGFLGGVPK